MKEAGRKSLPHDPPVGVGVGGQIFFLTVCAASSGNSPLLAGGRAKSLLESARHRHETGIWYVKIFLVMPDHVHALVRLPETASLRRTVADWKRWTCRNADITWQRDFFDHRLRSEESEHDKADYILMNPVRAGLCKSPADWPYVWIARD